MPYTLGEAKKVLIPQLEKAAKSIASIPRDACPGNLAVLRIDLHPAFISKSTFPGALLREAGLTHIGSKTIKVEPRRELRRTAPNISESTQLYVTATRAAIAKLPDFAASLEPDIAEANQFTQIENLSAMSPADRIKRDAKNAEAFEISLHAWPDHTIRQLYESFASYAASVGFRVNSKFLFPVGRMLFLGAEGDASALSELAQYSLIRSIRAMPKIRKLRPTVAEHAVSFPVVLPTAAPISDEPRVAILDGGLPKHHALGRFIENYELSDITAKDVPGYLEHGLGVTSAFLFGPLSTTHEAPRPYSYVDHFRVLDEQSDEEDPFELHRTLAHVEEVLLSGRYQFVNLSVGPESPTDDSDLHAWTASLDTLLADGNILMTVAAGNNGRASKENGLNRIMVPADCVNALTIGAADHSSRDWSRAAYSAVGPGRNPGRRKPDAVSFGGSRDEYFHIISSGRRPQMLATMGTSYAAPSVLRTAVGIRAVLGEDVHPLTIKALLINGAAKDDGHDPNEVGWGRVPAEVNEIILCGDGMARIIYQGLLKPGKFLRAPLPLPSKELKGKVKITATFCYTTPVDVEDSAAYTKAGLIVKFRPHIDKKEKKDAEGKKVTGTSAVTRPFFSHAEFRTEQEERADLGKWETVLHASDTMYGSSLKEASFDIHYNARAGGGPVQGRAELLRYALIVTVEAPRHAELYEDILEAHSKLKAIEPKISLPLRI
ncbi:S8 family peptidase [Acidovorax sp. NPDC077693]|uniref:S8 family peptidase n=1 Tax=unclassified Acidovorax TaxID=2684926 RepID=UPI0037CA4883